MNWEMVGAIAGILALLLSVLIEWPNLMNRLTGSAYSLGVITGISIHLVMSSYSMYWLSSVLLDIAPIGTLTDLVTKFILPILYFLFISSLVAVYNAPRRTSISALIGIGIGLAVLVTRFV